MTDRGQHIQIDVVRSKGAGTLPLSWTVLLLGQSGPNIEWVIHFDLRNTRCEKAHYRSGRPIAAFIPAAAGICRDHHQYRRGDETEPTTAYRTFMSTLPRDRANYQAMLSCGRSQPPTKAPAFPIIRSPNMRKPAPYTSHPATRPIMGMISRLSLDITFTFSLD